MEINSEEDYINLRSRIEAAFDKLEDEFNNNTTSNYDTYFDVLLDRYFGERASRLGHGVDTEATLLETELEARMMYEDLEDPEHHMGEDNDDNAEDEDGFVCNECKEKDWQERNK